MAEERKWLVIPLIIGVVIGLAIYFMFLSPARTGGNTEVTEAQDMANIIGVYNTKYSTYTNTLTDLTRYGNKMVSDNQTTTDELSNYETLLRTYMAAASGLVDSVNDVKTATLKYSSHFQDASATAAQFDNVKNSAYNDINNILDFIDVVRNNLQGQNPTHSSTLKDLSSELDKIQTN